MTDILRLNQVNDYPSDIMSRFGELLGRYYEDGKQYAYGIPGVKCCAGELNMSPGYFGDVVRNVSGESPILYIKDFIVERANSATNIRSISHACSKNRRGCCLQNILKRKTDETCSSKGISSLRYGGWHLRVLNRNRPDDTCWCGERRH